IYDWMKTIRNRGGNSPVIVVINKSDKGKDDLKLDESGLRESYDNIALFLRTSTDPDEWARETIKRLRERIVEIITTDERLKHVRDPIPANWLAIKMRVGAEADQRSILPHAKFVELCENPGRGTEPILDESAQRGLLGLLHQLGTVIAYGLEQDAPAAKREITLLDPNWLTGAMYRVLDNARTADEPGEFRRQDLAVWLDPSLYPSRLHEFILDMMQDKAVGLCFRLHEHTEERYLIPEALPKESPELYDWPADVLRFRYLYKYLPPGLIPRFIVQSHRNLAEKKLRWWRGVILTACNCRTLVRAYADKPRVDIGVAGPQNRRRDALNVILNDLEFVHKLNPEAEPEGVVPLPDQPERYESYRHLLMLEEKEGPDYTFYPTGAERKYAVSELLESVRRDDLKDPQGDWQKEGRGGPAIAYTVNQYGGSINMSHGGDIFRGIQNSTIVNRSLVERSFNKVKSEVDEETAKVLLKVAEAVAKSGNKEAGEILDQFNEELAKLEPRKSLLKRSWDSLLQVLPTVTTVANATAAVAKLFE
ncbi:MAG: COR domain-containing protein, partial [Candidatus Binatia bacterium]